MTEVKPEHKAGLELFAKVHGNDLDSMLCEDLDRLIAQASAAPEQGAALTPAAYRTIDEFGSCTLSIGKIHPDSRALVLADHAERLIRFGRYEVERLRAENKRLAAAVEYNKEPDDAEFGPGHPVFEMADEKDKASARAELAEQKLADAQALLRDANNAGGFVRFMDLRNRIDAFLSATAQPAESESHCPGDGVIACKECPDRAELREACKRFVAGNRPAERKTRVPLNACTECKGADGFLIGHDSSKDKPHSIRCGSCYKEVRAKEHTGLADAWNSLNPKTGVSVETTEGQTNE